MHYKRKLNFNKFKDNEEGNIWSLFWYHEISFKRNKEQFFIEAYFVLLKKEDYFLTNIKKDRIEKVVFPFSKSILFPLSSRFNYQGKFIGMSEAFDHKGQLLRNGLYTFNRTLVNGWDFKISKLDEIFANSLFPEVSKNGISIYEGAPHFMWTNTNNKKGSKNDPDEEIKKRAYFILPIDVVLKYFFGYSSLTLELLINNRLKDAISDITFDKVQEKGRIHYDSKQISREAVKKIAKYYFTKDDAAYKMISKIGAYFSEIKLAEENQKTFLKFKIPFNFPCDFIFVGQYFNTKSDSSDVTKFLANEILSMTAKEDFFLAKNGVDVIDINPSETQYEEGTEVKAGNPKKNGNPNPFDVDELDHLPLNQNNNDEIITDPILLRQCFDESPDIDDKIRKVDKNGEYVYVNDDRPNDHDDFKDSDGRKKNETRDIIGCYVDWFLVFRETINYLIQNYGYEATSLTNRATENQIFRRMIYELKYEGVNYYIIESETNYLPLFRNSKKGDSIPSEVIWEIITVIDKKFKSNWLTITDNKSLKANNKFADIKFLDEDDILFLRNSTHKGIYSDKKRTALNFEDTIKSQAKKIHKKIQKDLI